MDNENRSLRNNFYMGLYDTVIEEAKDATTNSAKSYYFRSLLEVNPKKCFDEVNSQSPTPHQAIKMLGTYREAANDNKEMVFDTVSEWLNDEILKDDRTLQLIAAQMYFEEGNYKEAMKLVSNPGEDLEKLSLQCQILLKLDRLDLAAKVTKSMQDIDDDDPLTQLSMAWTYICQGGEKVTEASFLLQGLIDMFGPSIRTLCSLAACQIHMNNHTGAFGQLKQARQMALTSKSKASVETLVNSAVCMLHLQKPEVVPKIVGEVEELGNEDAAGWLKQQKKMEEMFDKYAAHYS